MWSLFWRSSNSITELEASLAIYEPLVWISGGLVLLGVVAEVVADRRNFKNENTAHSLKKWGEYFLVFGLVGEIAFGIATSILSGLIIAKLTLETSKINGRATALESENLKLQELIQPRSITLDQQREIGDSLRSFAKRQIEVWSESRDPEAYFFSAQILAALKYAQMNVIDRRGMFTDSRASDIGVGILCPDEDKGLAVAIQKSLSRFVANVVTGPPRPFVSAVGGSVTFSPAQPICAVGVFAKPLPILK